MVLGSQKMVSGSQNMVLGGQKMVLGSQKMVLGSQKMVLGSQKIVLGSQKMVLGSQKMVLGSQKMVLGSQKMVLGSQKTPCLHLVPHVNHTNLNSNRQLQAHKPPHCFRPKTAHNFHNYKRLVYFPHRQYQNIFYSWLSTGNPFSNS